MFNSNSLAAFIDRVSGIDVLVKAASDKVRAAQKAMGVKPNIEEAERLTEEAFTTLKSLIRTAASIEVLTCKPTSQSVIDAVKKQTQALQLLAGEISICKTIIASQGSKPRQRSTEN